MFDESRKLQAPHLVAVWPGTVHIALAAGYYLLAILNRLDLFKAYKDRFLDLFRE